MLLLCCMGMILMLFSVFTVFTVGKRADREQMRELNSDLAETGIRQV